MPILQVFAPLGSPKSAMSPPPLTMAASRPASRNTLSACSVAQPLTSPVGSKPPGMAHGSNQPCESTRACSQSSSTTAISGGAAVRLNRPERNRLMGLSGFQVLKMSSSSCSLVHAAPIAARASAAGHSPASTWIETTVPMTGSAWTITALDSLHAELVESRLDRVRVRLARVGGARDPVDVSALNREDLAFKCRDDLLGQAL